MLAARLYDKGDLRLEDVKKPEINDNEVLLKVKSAAICGTDVRMFKNGSKDISPESPRILGHELSGIIAEVGKNVKGYKEGTRVTVAPNMGCGICNACVSGNGHLCGTYKALGINIDGGFAEYVVLPESAVRQGNISVIADNVSFDEAALNEPLSCVYNGFEKVGTRAGDTVLVVGAGPIGIMHAMLSRMAGASKVMMNDISAERLEVCKEIDPGIITIPGGELKDRVMEITGGAGPSVIITACPVPSVQAEALELAAVNGRINFFGGLPADRQNVALNTNLIHYKQLVVTGTTRASVLQYRTTLSFISSGILNIKKLVTFRFPLKDIMKGFEHASDAKGLKNIIYLEG